MQAVKKKLTTFNAEKKTCKHAPFLERALSLYQNDYTLRWICYSRAKAKATILPLHLQQGLLTFADLQFCRFAFRMYAPGGEPQPVPANYLLLDVKTIYDMQCKHIV